MKHLVIMFLTLLVFASSPVFAEISPSAEPDNSGINRRDRSESAKTPENQGSDQGDVELTRQIRKEITQDDSLSTLAHNVKIVTEKGKVTLRGPVNSQNEKEKIGQKAQQIAGADKVQNELDVKSSDKR
jgi:hyperosmotically inducible periplasmic protein